MSNVIDLKAFKNSKKQLARNNRQDALQGWMLSTAFKLKNVFIRCARFLCQLFLSFVSVLSGKLMKWVSTLSILLFIVECLAGRLGATEFYNLMFLIGMLLIIKVVSKKCLKRMINANE